MLSVSAWDHAGGAPLHAKMATTALGPGTGPLGSEFLADFGDTTEHLGAVPATTDAEAQALADALGARRARRFVTARGSALGNPQLRVGTQVTLTGLGPRFSNSYHVTAAWHRFDRKSGYITDFEAECAHFNGKTA
jgi:phage protein D